MAGSGPAVRDDQGALDRIGGVSALAAAALTIVYSLAFVALRGQSLGQTLTAVALMAGGLLSAMALAAVYRHIAVSEPGLALLGLALGLVGTFGATVHGGFDLANVIHPEDASTIAGPNPVDPRGLLTFGISGLGVLVLSWAALRAFFPRWLGWLGIVLGVLLIVVYLGRLAILDPNNVLLLAPAALAGVIISPAWYAAIGMRLLGRPIGPS